MSRLAPIISLDEFKNKIQENLFNEEGFFSSHELPISVLKDISKIRFDFENYEINDADKNNDPKYGPRNFNNYPCGYEVLSNGLPVLFVNAGGDWEFPICFVIYWDGKKLRGYIPKNGNIYNTKTKAAYGNEYDYGEEDVDTESGEYHPDPEKIREDIIKRIQIK